MAIERFELLEVWQVAHEVVLAVYRLTSAFPDHERFGLTSQMRRASVFHSRQHCRRFQTTRFARQDTFLQ